MYTFSAIVTLAVVTKIDSSHPRPLKQNGRVDCIRSFTKNRPYCGIGYETPINDTNMSNLQQLPDPTTFEID